MAKLLVDSIDKDYLNDKSQPLNEQNPKRSTKKITILGQY